ncbi:MAG TPA: hypothetical protein VGM39_06920 [Kofleriaceae bacterium]|jgi:hypothetical protein
MTRLTLRDLVAAGGRGLARYTGTLLAVFVVESLIAAAIMLGAFFVLSRAFAMLPMFDEGVDGDPVALMYCIRHTPSALLATIGLVSGGLFVWQLISWFLAGGLNAVFAQRPETRSETARVFGAGGTSTYLAYARLALLSLPSWGLAIMVFLMCARVAVPHMQHAVAFTDIIGPLALLIIPFALVMHIAWTVTDYTRVELSLRHESHDPSVLASYIRSVVFVLRRPLTLVHGAFGWILFGVITLAYHAIAFDHPMYGVEGALTLYVARQCVSLLRMAIRVGVMGGQVELGRTRALPPRRAPDDVASDST